MWLGNLGLGWGDDGILGSVRVFEKGLGSTVWILAHGGWTCQIRCMVFLFGTGFQGRDGVQL